MTKSYTLNDAFDGKTLETLHRISSRAKARKAAKLYCARATDDFSLIEIKNGERFLVATFTPKAA